MPVKDFALEYGPKDPMPDDDEDIEEEAAFKRVMGIEQEDEGAPVVEGDLLTEADEAFMETLPVEEGKVMDLVPRQETVPARPQAGAISDSELQEIQLLCEFASQSDMFPKETEVSLLTKALLGRALRIPPIAAFTGIYTIQTATSTTASISAKLQRALAMREGYDIREVESNRQRCELMLFRRATGELIGSATFTAEEAERAKLLGNDPWQKRREDMLWKSCSSRLLDRYAPYLEFGIDVDMSAISKQVERLTGKD